MQVKSYMKLELEHCLKDKNIKTIDVDNEYEHLKLYNTSSYQCEKFKLK